MLFAGSHASLLDIHTWGLLAMQKFHAEVKRTRKLQDSGRRALPEYGVTAGVSAFGCQLQLRIPLSVHSAPPDPGYIDSNGHSKQICMV